jgi:alpha-tubulin suppressor-like RCC1 family protein
VDAGLHHTCALTLANQTMCWGFNRFGQLGDRSVFDEESSPVASAARAAGYPADALRLLPGVGK